MDSSLKERFVLMILICFTIEAIQPATSTSTSTTTTPTSTSTTTPTSTSTTTPTSTSTTTPTSTSTTTPTSTSTTTPTSTSTTTPTSTSTTTPTSTSTTTPTSTSTTTPTSTSTTTPTSTSTTTPTSTSTTTPTSTSTTTPSSTSTTPPETENNATTVTTTPAVATSASEGSSKRGSIMSPGTSIPAELVSVHSSTGTNAKQSDDDDSKVPVPAFIGAISGVLVLAVVIAALCFVYGKRRRKRATSKAVNDENLCKMERLDAAHGHVRTETLDTGKPNPNPYSNFGRLAVSDDYSSLDGDVKDTPNNQPDLSFAASRRKPGTIDTENVYTNLDERDIAAGARDDNYVNAPIRQDDENSYFTNMDTRRDSDPHIYSSINETK